MWYLPPKASVRIDGTLYVKYSTWHITEDQKESLSFSPDKTSFNKSLLYQSAKNSSRTLFHADSISTYWVYILPLTWLGVKQENLIKFILPDPYLPVLHSVSPENNIDLPPIPTPPSFKPSIAGAQLAASTWLGGQVDTEHSQERSGLPCPRSHVQANSDVKVLVRHTAFGELWTWGLSSSVPTGPCFRVWGPQLGFLYLRDTLISLRAPALEVPTTTLGNPE